MFRSAGKLVGGAAGIAATGPAVSAQCRSHQPRTIAPALLQDDFYKRAEASQKTAGLGEDWLVTDLKHALNEDQVIFGDEEIDETMESVFAYTSGLREEPHIGGVRITEVNEDGEVEEALAMDDSHIHTQAADMQIVASQEVQQDFNRMLSKLLHNPEVQGACIRALRDDQVFQNILDAPPAAPIDIPIKQLMPNTGVVVEEDDEGTGQEGGGMNPFVDLIQKIASGIQQLGDQIREKAIGARNLIGKLFIELGCSLHEMLGQPFGSTPVDEANEESNPRAEMVGNALITVACAILTLVLVKRVHRIRFV